MCVCLEDLPKIYLLFIILYSDDSCEGAGGGLIKSHYCPYWWILFICLFVGFLLFLALGVAVQVIYVPLFSLILVLMLFYINVSLCFHCFTFNCLLFCFWPVVSFYFVSSLPWEGGPQVVLICWPEPHGSFLMPSQGLIFICYLLFCFLCFYFSLFFIWCCL